MDFLHFQGWGYKGLHHARYMYFVAIAEARNGGLREVPSLPVILLLLRIAVWLLALVG